MAKTKKTTSNLEASGGRRRGYFTTPVRKRSARSKAKARGGSCNW